MKQINVQELNKWITSKKEFDLIDVREPVEWDICNLPNAILIPMNKIPYKLEKISKEIPVVIHCKKGGRSQKIIEYLKVQGYNNLYNLEGGILEWINQIDQEMPKY